MLSSPLPYAQSAFCFPSQRLPRGVSERPPLWGEPRPECVGAPTGSSRSGQASRPARAPTAPSGGPAKEEPSGPAVAARWALFLGPVLFSGSRFLSP